MPVRVYRCLRGHETEVPLPSGPYPKIHPCDFCTDDQARAVPATFNGKVSSETLEAKLKKRGLIPWERGMEADARKNMESKQQKFERRIEAECAQVVRENQDIRPD